MASLKDIRRRINAVRGTQKVTRAMKLIAAARLKRAQQRALDARTYASELRASALNISRRLGVNAPLFFQRPKEINHIDLVVVTSDRGLCGGFNENLLRAIDDEILNAREHNITTTLFVIGRKGIRYTKLKGYDVHAVVLGNDTAKSAAELTGVLAERMRAGKSAGCNVAFNRMAGSSQHKIKFWNLLPLYQRGKSSERFLEYFYEPEREEVLENFCMESLKSSLSLAVLESNASELAARMTAMDSATKNAADMIMELTFEYNRRRQETITKELIDIVGGAEALK